jgi:hypothetical protein
VFFNLFAKPAGRNKKLEIRFIAVQKSVEANYTDACSKDWQ